MTPLSLRVRLTLWYTLTLMTMLGLAGLGVSWQQGRLGMRRVDRGLEALSATIARLLDDELLEDPVLASAADEVIEAAAMPGSAAAVFDDRGQVAAMRWDGLALPRFADVQAVAGPWTVDSADGGWRLLARPQRFPDRAVTIVVASPLAEVVRERREVQQAMLVGIPIALGLAAIGGLWLAAVGLRPITQMAHRAASIPLSGMEDLGGSTRRDELGQLAAAFNGLVARLRTALSTQRQFMADASHELRTPVSVIRSAADVMLSRDHRDEAEYREALTIVRGEARRASRLVEDMLVLGRADAGGYPLQIGRLYLDELVNECRRTVDVLASERQVSVEYSSPVDLPFAGDEELLRRMLVNLIQNAVQHTPDGGCVRIQVTRQDRAVTILVIDPGSGISPENQNRIFDRFVQLDPSRRGSGAGLGLPIARWIAEAHGGSLDLAASSASGSTFRVVLPVAADA